MSLDLPVELLRQLVRIPSMNRMGRDLSGEAFGEARLTDRLEEWFRRWEVPFARYEVHPGRENIVARFDGNLPLSEPGSLLLFEAHQDTVPVDGMTIAPFEAAIDDDRLYGRGACDVKGTMAAMLAAAKRRLDWQRSEAPVPEKEPLPTVLVALTVNEEFGFTGAQDLADRFARKRFDEILPRLPDGAVVGEPTDLRIVVAHKGVTRWRCRTHGKAAHGSHPEEGENAIYHMARLILAIERYAEEVLAASPEHPHCGRPSLNVGLLAGGSAPNIVPDRCELNVDRRMVPGESAEAAHREMVDYLSAQAFDFAYSVLPPYMSAGALSESASRPIADRLAESLSARGIEVHREGVDYATDAPFFAGCGIPTVVFGPGSIEQAHTIDEWIALDALNSATGVFLRLLGAPPRAAR
jgi:acetylornithine deacetylase